MHWKKIDVILTKEDFVDFKKGFVHEVKLKNNFVLCTKPSKKDSLTAEKHSESDLGSDEIFLRVSIFETK